MELFDEMSEPGAVRSREALPVAVLALAAATRTAASVRCPIDPEGLTLPSRNGWVTLHASRPDGPRSDRVAIIVERARSERVASIRLLAYGLTAREREIAALVVAGMSTRDIAARLFISPHTVQTISRASSRRRAPAPAESLSHASSSPNICRASKMGCRSTRTVRLPTR